MDIQWDKVGQEAAELLAQLIRINTSNPPGNEVAACEFLKPLYTELGLNPKVLGPEPSRQSIIGRLKADRPEGEQEGYYHYRRFRRLLVPRPGRRHLLAQYRG